MNRSECRKLRPECRFDRLESRELMNAHLPRPQIAHVAQLGHSAPRTIHGTMNGVSSYVGVLTGSDTYSLSGQTSAGQAGISGTDDFSSTLLNPNTYSDLYYGGSWEMTMGNGSIVQIAYTGSGKSAVSTGKFTENLKGTAIGISGSMVGKQFAFTGSLTGPGTTPATTMTFKLTS